jgi:hypothetical protein
MMRGARDVAHWQILLQKSGMTEADIDRPLLIDFDL